MKSSIFSHQNKAWQNIFNFIEKFYNLLHRHTQNDGILPVKYEIPFNQKLLTTDETDIDSNEISLDGNTRTTLRIFVPKDADRVFELLQDVSAYKPDAYKASELVRHFAEHKDTYACVAFSKRSLVGFGSLFVLNRVRGGRSGVIEDVVVAAECRGQGVGRLIMEDLLKQAKKRGCFKISLECSPISEQFYSKLGFEMGGNVMKYFP